jgi:hypothetical protein
MADLSRARARLTFSRRYVGLLGLEVDFPERAAPQAVAATIRRAMDDATLSHVKSVPTTSV